MMAPHKCNFIVFSKNKSKCDDEELEIKLLGINLNKNDSPTF
jgi:hypothetical protein